MKLILILALSGITLSGMFPAEGAMVQVPSLPGATKTNVIRLVYKNGLARAVVREIGTDSLETLRLNVYSCSAGKVVSSFEAGSGLKIQSISDIPYQTKLINAVKVIDGMTNQLAWIFTDSGALIPQQVFGSLVPRAVSPDGLVVVCSIPADLMPAGSRKAATASVTKFGYAFDGHRLVSLAAYDESIKEQLFDSAWRTVKRIVTYTFITAMVAFVAVSLWRRPFTAKPA